MGIISDVKCGRCDRRYSGLRGRCPYCGARRGKRGKHANDSDNSKGKLIIGILLVLVLIIAVAVLVITNINQKKKLEQQNNEQQQVSENDDDVSGVEGTPETQTDGSGTDTVPPTTDDSGTDAPDTSTPDTNTDGETPADDAAGSVTTDGDTQQQNKITSVSILSFGVATSDFTINVGQTLTLTYATTPAGAGTNVTWKSSNEKIFTILQTGEFTAVSSGKATLTLTVDGVSTECIVRVN